MEVESIVSKFKPEIGEDFLPQDALLEYIEQLKNVFSGKVDTSKLDNYLGLIFPESPTEGVLGFLQKKLGEKWYEKAKEQVFQLIQFLLMQRKWKADVNRFCIRFKTIADMYWKNRKENARLQQAALDCLITLYDNFGTAIDIQEFDTTQLYWELLKRSEQSTHQPTVRAKMFHLMGILSSLGRESFMKDGCFSQLFNHYTTTVKSQVESTDAHLEVSILLGCMNGMDAMLRTFGTTIDTNNPLWIQFQNHLEQIVDPHCSIVKGDGKAKLKRREFQRAALALVANHGALLEKGLFHKYKQWYEDLIVWSKSSNVDDHRVGRKAMYKFLETIIGYSRSLMDDDESKSLKNERFRFFADKFKSVLAIKDPNKTELGIAVRGFGMLSGLCEEQEQTRKMFDLILQHIDNIIIELDSTSIDKYNSSLTTVPTYLEAVASIIPSVDVTAGIPEQQFESIKKLTVILIRLYPDLSDTFRRFCHISVQKVVDSLWHHHHTLCEPFINQVYHQSLLHIISSPTRAEVDILMESYKKSHPDSKKSAMSQLGLKPVTSYIQFWKQLLGSGITASASLRFDLLMKWILSTVGKLDLSINFDEDPLSALDPVQGATANVAKDFQIFVNLVDFFQELMTEKSLHRQFEKWVIAFSIEVLGHIKSHAYVSGFYKILAVVFDSARSLEFFEQQTVERSDLLKQLNIFFKILGTKINEFRDDLLFSVLELWLSLPDVLILTNFTALNQTLQTVFTTGRNSFSLAVRGLEAIERWFFKPKFPVNEIETIMNSLFPILKTYFLHSELVDNELSKKSVPEPSKSDLKHLVKKNVQIAQADEDPTLKEIQLKILKLVGYFGTFIRLEEKQHLGLATDKQFLTYAVPFQDCKPELYLDDLLHRVLELCENAVNRQTRVSACEFFHTVALIFIGKSREGGKFSLFKQIFYAMLKLGCDSDICVRQLFNPLCLQAIHWFSKPDSPYGELLLQILTENLSQHEDPNLREFAGVCIGEYFLWSLKHSQSSQNLKAIGILKTICAMSTHASGDFRQGSVLAFNSIYRDFREDSYLVNEFSFDLLYSFLISLQLSKDLPEDSLLVTNTKQSIGRLERIFIKKKTIFNTALRRRFKPDTNAGSGSERTLSNVVQWLVNHGGNTARVFREECLRLTSVLAPCVPDKGSTENYLLGIEEEKGLENWINIAETSANNRNILQDQLVFLEASSDFYNFLFVNGVLKKTVFTNSKSVFCQALLSLSTENDGGERLCDEVALGLLRMFSRLKFAWELVDSESLSILWKYSMELSKNHLSSYSPELLFALVKVWAFRDPTPTMKSLCRPLFLFEPDDLIRSDDTSSALRQAQWYRAVAEGRLYTSMLSKDDLNSMNEKLWRSIQSSLFKQTLASTGQLWESHNLSLNIRKIVESYLVIPLYCGLDPDMVVDAVFDATSVTHHDGTFRLVVTKGQIFQNELLNALVYCNRLFKFDALVLQRPIKDVGEFIQRTLALLKSDRKLKKRGEVVFDKTMKHWKVISINCDVRTTVKIFAGLIAINPNLCRDSIELSSWWNGNYLMNATHLDLKQKAEVFGYVSIFSSSRNQRIIEELLNTISNLVNGLKPVKMLWTDVEPFVTHIFRRILKVFEELPRNLKSLEPILRMIQKVSIWTNNVTNHVLFRLARETLEKAFQVLYTTDSIRVSMAAHIYNFITANDDKLMVETVPVWKFSLLPVVASLRTSEAEKFFKNHIFDILAKTDIEAVNAYDWNLKTLAIHLLELLVYQTSAEFIKGEKLADAYYSSMPQDKRQQETKAEQEKVKIVYKNMCRVCIAGLTTTTLAPSSQDSALRTFALNYQIACYNTLSATLLVTKAETKFFSKFLFPGRKIFESIVDTSVSYEFPIVIDEDRHKEGIVDHRKSQNTPESSVADALKYFRASGNLAGSSLAPEATSYDFTTSVTVANSEYYQRIFGETKSGVSTPQGQRQSMRAKLEWSEINEHGCMFSYVEILKQMGEFHRLNPACERNWATTLKSILTSNVHNNVKIFIVGGIVNAPTSVEPFAGELIEPIIRLVLTDCFGSIKFNHFVQDILITLLSWNKTCNPEKESVAGLLDYMLESVQSEEVSGRKDILTHALELLQNIVKLWVSERSVVPEDNIFAIKDEALMLQICLNFLLGGQLPQKTINPNSLMKRFLTSCSNRLKGIYFTAAKCIGVLLRQIKQNASKDGAESHIQSVTKKLLVLSKGKPAVFVEIISGVRQNFAEIILRVKDVILELMKRPKIRPEILVLLPMLLKEMLAEGAADDNEMKTLPQDCGAEFFIDIDGRGVFQQSCSSESEMYAALKLLEMFIGNISNHAKLLKIVDWVQCAESSSKKEIRLHYVTVLLKLYERLVSDAGESLLDLSIKNIFLKTFVRMYGDEDQSTHTVINQFWTVVLRDWRQSSDLLVELFDLMDQNENALHVCLGLILQRCSLSPDYSKHIFPEPLEDCQFLPFELDTSWRLRHSSFQPLFAESLSTAQNFSMLPRAIQSSVLSQKRSVGKFGMNVLRATLDNLQFTPTLKERNNSESLMDVDESIAGQTFSMPTISSDSTLITNEDDNVPENLILKLRRKFYASKDSAFYATKTTEKRDEREEVAKDLERSRISGVKTVRSYRIGKLPDILILHSDLLNTLLKLTKHDQLVGHQFLVYLFSGMTKEMDRTACRKLCHKSTEVFNRVLRNSLSSIDRSLASIIVEVSIFNNIPVQSALVLEVSKAANIQKLGILKLEEELLNEAAESSHSSSKRAKVQHVDNSHEEDVWLGIAEMYREMDEYDVLRNIFTFAQDKTLDSERKILYGKVGNALYLEGQGHLEKALTVFDESLNGEVEGTVEYSATMKTFLEDAIMQCLTKLSDWESLYTLAGNFNTAVSEDFFQNQNTVERLIPVQMRSGMHLVLRSENEEEPDNSYSKFQTFMQTSLETEEGTAHLTSKFPFDVGAWLIVQDENEFSPQANLLLDRGNEALTQKFKILESMPLKTQKQIMVSLQQASVLCDFLGWRKQTQSSGGNSKAKEDHTRQLLGNWRKGFDHQPMDLLGSDLIAAHRDHFASKIGITLESSGSQEEMLLEVQTFRVEKDLWLANLGVVHKNYAVSHHSLQRLKSSGRDELKPTEFYKAMAKFLTTFYEILGREDWCKRWCSVYKKLAKIRNHKDMFNTKADLLYCLSDAAPKSGEADPVFSSVIKTLNGNSSSTLTESVLRNTLELVNTCDVEDGYDTSHSSSLYSKLFHLLKKLSNSAILESKDEVALKMLRCLLRGCAEGKSSDMLQLSNMFSLLKKFPNLISAFGEMMIDVPSYLFLPWIDQIVTTYRSDTQLYAVFRTLIDRLVTDYPQAFQLQYPEFLNSNYQLFADALKAVVLPSRMHSGILEHIDNSRTEEQLVQNLTKFQDTLQAILNSSNKIYGNSHKDYATEMFHNVHDELTEYKKSSQNSGSEASSIRSSLQGCVRKIRKSQDNNRKKELQSSKLLSLRSLSPFLDEFHFFEYEPIERPGLYSDFRKVKTEDNPHIVSFHPTVLLYASVTQPLRVTLVCNNGKRSNILAKLGDDLNQDRRIQQLFKISNVLFEDDSRIASRNIGIVTYSCIPITSDFGIIDMVDNVISLCEMIFDTTELKTKRNDTRQLYEAMITQKSGNSKGLTRYKLCANKVNREQAEQLFNEVSSKLPDSLLRDNVKRRAKNLQDYLTIRQDMIKSYGALCMVHWLLGIGDRHLENCLVSMASGKLVGIDFGRAFGTSNCIIPVPEMVPFRLTPQLQHLMMPYSFKGLFRELCIVTWKCLRDASETILTAADVFIQEPSMDWLKIRQRPSANQSNDDQSPTAIKNSWAPMEIMERKLLGHNPTNLLLEELKVQPKDIATIYSKIAQDGRMHLEKTEVSVEEYVDILLDLATDKNVLSRLYSGWNSWV